MVNFVPAVACHFCLNLPAAFSQPGARLILEPCLFLFKMSRYFFACIVIICLKFLFDGNGFFLIYSDSCGKKAYVLIAGLYHVKSRRLRCLLSFFILGQLLFDQASASQGDRRRRANAAVVAAAGANGVASRLQMGSSKQVQIFVYNSQLLLH